MPTSAAAGEEGHPAIRWVKTLRTAIMGSAAGGRYRYTAGNARLYGSLGIEGTTYQIGFDAARELLGPVRGMTLLDFGCGAGRSAAWLRALGAGHVYGVDHDPDMIAEAESRGLDGATFLHAHGTIPLPDASADGAVSLNVFIEMRTPGEMRRACSEIARVLRPGGPFILESSSPMAFGHAFRSYSYPHGGSLRSGDTTTCIVTTPDGQLVIEDTYWTQDDYTSTLEHAGLTAAAVVYPLPRDPAAWATDEASVPPCIVIKAIKASG
jgi:SAM-dependent methyltransferase